MIIQYSSGMLQKVMSDNSEVCTGETDDYMTELLLFFFSFFLNNILLYEFTTVYPFLPKDILVASKIWQL